MQFTKALQHTIVWKMMNTILVFFVNLLLVRILGTGNSGEFFYALAALSFFILVISCSVESGITYYGSNNAGNIFYLSLFILPWLALQGVASWLLLGLIRINIAPEHAWLFVISNLVIIYFSALYYSKKWFLSLNLCAVVVNAGVLLVLGYIYYRYKPGGQAISPDNGIHAISSGVYLGGFIIQAIIMIILFFSWSGLKYVPADITSSLIKKVFKYSAIAFVSNVLFFLVIRIDYYFVQRFCDVTALSNYVQVSKMGQLLILLPSMIAVVLFPFSSGVPDREYLHKLHFICRIITVLFIPVAIVVVATGSWIFPWLFGDGFGQMYMAMVWYLPGFYALSLVTILAAYLAGRAMLTANLVASMIALMVVIVGDVLLIPLYGINAAAATSSVAYICCLLYLLSILKNRMHSSYSDFFLLTPADRRRLLSRLKKH